MTPEAASELYDTVLRYAALPVLAVLILVSWLIANCLMSQRWQQARRNREIRRAAAALRAYTAARITENERDCSDETHKARL